jgi:hypothetical protein
MNQPAYSVTKQTFCAAISIIFAALFAMSAPAQSADKIVKQAVKAMTNGKGEKALREIRSWQVKGTITSLKDDSSGGYRAAAAQPNLYVREFDLRGLEVSAGYNGKSAWARDSRDGLRTLTGAANLDRRRKSRLSVRGALPQRPMAGLQKREIEACPRWARDDPGEARECGRSDHGQER